MPRLLLHTLRTAIASGAFLLPACVIKLSDVNAPLENGGVTGSAADCSKVQPVGKGGLGSGPAEPRFIGRFDATDPKRVRFDWSGSMITARFEGSQVSVGLETDKPVLFTAVVDDDLSFEFTVEVGRTGYVVKTDLRPGPHEITLVRNSEALYGVTTFTGFDFGPGGKLLPPTERPRRVEYIGDSITCGYGNEGANATCPFDIPVKRDDPKSDRVPISENIYAAYGSIAARALSAEAVTVCFSGKGIYQNYRERGTGEGPTAIGEAPDPDAKTTMPMYWERTLGTEREGPKWDFTKEPEPQVVVISLGTNDFARDANQDSIADGIDLGVFKRTYAEFVAKVRSLRPNAHVFLALPPMVTDKFPLDDARTDFRNILRAIVTDAHGRGDQNVYFIELVQMGTRYGLGCDYHPNLEVHRIMADQVAGAIRTKTCW